MLKALNLFLRNDQTHVKLVVLFDHTANLKLQSGSHWFSLQRYTSWSTAIAASLLINKGKKFTDERGSFYRKLSRKSVIVELFLDTHEERL
jgi:hypothetical protein